MSVKSRLRFGSSKINFRECNDGSLEPRLLRISEVPEVKVSRLGYQFKWIEKPFFYANTCSHQAST